MQNFVKLAIIAAAASTLSACGGTGSTNRSLDSIHQPVVRNSIFTFDVSTLGGELPPSEEARLSGWLDAMGASYGDRIAVEDPSMYGKGQATARIRAMVERRGLLLSDAVPVTAGMVPSGYLRVTITRATAHVPGCPNWDSKSDTNMRNVTSSNYGCATNSNLAAMIADPNDLIKGANDQRTDPSSAARPVRVFREREPTGKAGTLPQTSTQQGGGQ